MAYVQDEARFDDHPGRTMLRAREPVEARGGDGARVDDEAGDNGSEFPAPA